MNLTLTKIWSFIWNQIKSKVIKNIMNFSYFQRNSRRGSKFDLLVEKTKFFWEDYEQQESSQYVKMLKKYVTEPLCPKIISDFAEKWLKYAYIWYYDLITKNEDFYNLKKEKESKRKNKTLDQAKEIYDSVNYLEDPVEMMTEILKKKKQQEYNEKQSIFSMANSFFRKFASKESKAILGEVYSSEAFDYALLLIGEHDKFDKAKKAWRTKKTKSLETYEDKINALRETAKTSSVAKDKMLDLLNRKFEEINSNVEESASISIQNIPSKLVEYSLLWDSIIEDVVKDVTNKTKKSLEDILTYTHIHKNPNIVQSEKKNQEWIFEKINEKDFYEKHILKIWVKNVTTNKSKYCTGSWINLDKKIKWLNLETMNQIDWKKEINILLIDWWDWKDMSDSITKQIFKKYWLWKVANDLDSTKTHELF